MSEERTAEARTNVKRLGKETQIQVICGDAAETLKELPDDAYEFAFVDAAKAQYIYYLPDVLRVLKPGGVIVSDNILQEGEVLESHFWWKSGTARSMTGCGNICMCSHMMIGWRQPSCQWGMVWQSRFCGNYVRKVNYSISG